MNEDQNEQSGSDQNESAAPETASTTPAPEVSETEPTTEAIALPSETPAPAESLPLPEQVEQPDTPPQGMPEAGSAAGSTPPQGVPMPGNTPPQGVPVQGSTPPQGVPVQGSTPPQGTYAMGALAGNPALGAAPGSPSSPYGPYGYGPSTDPGAPMWNMPPAPAASSSGASHRVRNGLLAGVAGLAVLAAGVGIGHAAWTHGNNASVQGSAPSGNNRLPSGSGNGNNGNNGFPGFFGGGNSGSGNSGSGNSGSSNSGSSGPSDVNAIASKVDPGLVDINTTLGYQQEQAAGTGIVLTSNGVVLTNNHVINGATSISVTDVGNQKTYTASVVGYDRSKDIAVLQLHNASGLQTATLGDSSSISVGQDVVGVGNAGGTGGTPSAAGGTVTALNQSITASDSGDGTSEQLGGLIETNANIQPGDSGGALVDTNGAVIGVDTAASAGYSFQFNGQSDGNQGFAIPINTALSIARAIEAGNGSSTIHIGATAFLGVEVSPSGSSSSNGGGNGFGGGFGGFFGNSGNTGNGGSSASGASVAGTVTNGPAQEAGLAQGDVITSLGGQTISSATDLTNAMLQHHPGDKVTVSWTDTNGQTHTATVQLSSGPPQ
jgi:S1-C subfamily serine protease